MPKSPMKLVHLSPAKKQPDTDFEKLFEFYDSIIEGQNKYLAQLENMSHYKSSTQFLRDMENKIARNQITHLVNEKECIQNDFIRANEEINELKKNNDELTKNCTTISENYETNNNIIRELCKEKKEMSEENVKMYKKIEKIDTMLKNKTNLLIEAEKREQDNKKQINKLELDYDKIKNELADKNKQLEEVVSAKDKLCAKFTNILSLATEN